MIVIESIILFVIISAPVWSLFIRNSHYALTIVLDLFVFLIIFENQRLKACEKENKDESDND